MGSRLNYYSSKTLLTSVDGRSSKGFRLDYHLESSRWRTGDGLSEQKEDSGAKLPDMILLDLNMPKKNGHEVLADITRFDTENDTSRFIDSVAKR